MAIELVTFGGLHILDDEGELDWLAGQRSRAALLVYLAIERRVSREALTTVFWPESDTENARHALRQSLYQLKKAVQTDWVESLAHELVVTSDVRVDVHEFTDAIAREDLDSAVRLYRGPFLHGVHLADLSSWESWVDNKRTQYARAFRNACRNLLQSRHARGDMRGAVNVAELWVSRDPSDDEAQHRLIETLAGAGERAEAIRQYDAYIRMMESEDLASSEETRALGDRLRAEPSTLPSFAAASAPLIEPAREPTTTAFPRNVVIGVVVSFVIIVALWYVNRVRHATIPSSNAIAVLPFTVRGDQSVGYLREGMVNLLTAAFDGAGTVRPVDARATFAASDNASDANAAAFKLGAGMYVLGDVTSAGGRLQIDAAVYKRGSKEPRARAVVSGRRDSVFSLADRLAARLLAELSDPAADRLLRTASVTTSSLSAFKEYLQGERLMRLGQFESAADSYEAAVAHDSTFAVAYYRLALAREWAPLGGNELAAARAAHFAAHLSPRDRNLLEAFRLWRLGQAGEAERAYRAILARYPDDLDAWFQLAEIQFHHGPLLGSSIRESEIAWRKVLAYEPRNLYAITHLARIAMIDNRVSYVDSMLAKFSSNDLQTDRRLIEVLMLRAVARGDTSTTLALTNATKKWEGLSAWRVAVFLTAFTSKPEDMRRVVPDLMDTRASPALRADVLWFASLLDLATGRLGASRASLAKAGEAEGSMPAGKSRGGFDRTTEWHAATLPVPYPDSMLQRVRQRASSQRGGPGNESSALHHDTDLGAPIQLESVRQYTLGILSLRLRDTAAASVASGRLREMGASKAATILTRDLNRGLQAHVSWQRGKADEALRSLNAMESNDNPGDIAATPFVSRANERFLRGDILAATGRNAEALRWFGSLGVGSVSEVPLRALAHYRQAEILERLNRRDEAARHYMRFVELWSHADQQFQPMVSHARQRIVKGNR